jgi:anthranilate 1,2-dioxygenase small subunit
MNVASPVAKSVIQMDPQELRDLKGRIRDLNEDYAWVLDNQELNAWPKFFTEDCLYRAISRENFDEGLPHATLYCDGLNMVKDRSLALQETAVFEPRHQKRFVSGVRILGREGGEILSSANFQVVESMSDREPRILFVGSYHDRIVEIDGALKFKERSAVFDNYRVYTSLVIPI